MLQELQAGLQAHVCSEITLRFLKFVKFCNMFYIIVTMYYVWKNYNSGLKMDLLNR